MTDDPRLALIHAELDGELDERQRAELSRSLLADPQLRSLRDELRRVCAKLESLEPVDPPPGLRSAILGALPQAPYAAVQQRRPAPRWRYAAVVAAALVGAAVLYEVGRSPMPASDAVGTIAASHSASTGRVESDALSGSLRLYRDPTGLSLEYDLVSKGPADMVVAGGGKTLRVTGVGGPAGGAPQQRLPLIGFGAGTASVEVTFVMDGRAVAGTTLQVPQEQ